MNKVQKYLQSIINKNKYNSICSPMNLLDKTLQNKVYKVSTKCNMVIFDQKYDNFNTVLVVPYKTTSNYVKLQYIDEIGDIQPYIVQDFMYLCMIPENIKTEQIFIIPSLHFLDSESPELRVKWKTNKYGGLIADRSLQYLKQEAEYPYLVNYPHCTGVYMKRMLNPGKKF